MNRINAVLLLLVAGLCVMFWVSSTTETQHQKKETAEKRLFPDAKADQLTSVTVEPLKQKTAALTLKKDGLLWYNGEGAERKTLSDAMVGGSIRSLVDLQRTEGIDSGEVKLSDLGLATPSYRISMTFKDGKSGELLVGDMTPDDQSYYARSSDGKIATIPKAIGDLLDAKVDRFREVAVLPYDPSKINHLTMISANGTVELGLEKPREAKPEENLDEGIQVTDLSEKWQLLKPETGSADANKVRDYLWSLKNSHSERFLNPTEKVDFSKPMVHIELGVDGASHPFKLDIGAPVPVKPSLYYVRRYDPDETMVVTLKDPSAFMPAANHFLERHVAGSFELNLVNKITLTGAQELVATRGAGNWDVSKPDKAISNTTTRDSVCNELLTNVKNLEWDAKASAPADWKERTHVTLTSKEGGTIGGFAVGPADPKGGCFVRTDGDSQTYHLPFDPTTTWQAEVNRLLVNPAPAFTPKPGALIPTPVASPAH